MSVLHVDWHYFYSSIRHLQLFSSKGWLGFIKYQFSAFQDPYSSSSFFLNFASSGKTDGKEIHDLSRSWASELREYTLCIVERRKSSLPLSQPQETFITGKCLERPCIPWVLKHAVTGSWLIWCICLKFISFASYSRIPHYVFLQECPCYSVPFLVF